MTCRVCKPLVDCRLAPEVTGTQSLGCKVSCWHGSQAAPSRSWWKRVDRAGFCLFHQRLAPPLSGSFLSTSLSTSSVAFMASQERDTPPFPAVPSLHRCSSISHTRLWIPGALCLQPLPRASNVPKGQRGFPQGSGMEIEI